MLENCEFVKFSGLSSKLPCVRYNLSISALCGRPDYCHVLVTQWEIPGELLMFSLVHWISASVSADSAYIYGQCSKMDHSTAERRTETTELQVLTDHYKTLCTVLPVDELIPELITKRIISFEDEEIILSKQTRNQKAQVLLKVIVRDGRVGNASKFYKFLDVIRNNVKCSFLAERIIKDLGAAGTMQWTTTADNYKAELGPGEFSVCNMFYVGFPA